jgi:hypothetical protein
MLTNASPEQLPTTTVLEVYRVRWQVDTFHHYYVHRHTFETSA